MAFRFKDLEEPMGAVSGMAADMQVAGEDTPTAVMPWSPLDPNPN